MEYLRFLVTPLVGGVIGYFTNWLAIKMLFVPRTEKRVLGVRVPFTPGVLPKSKERLANKVGETVGDYLLTEETIKEVVQNANISDNIDDLIEMCMKKLLLEDYTVGDLTGKFFKEKNGEALDKFAADFCSFFFSIVEDEKNQNFIRDILKNQMEAGAKEIRLENYGELFAGKIESIVESNLNGFIRSEEFEKFLYLNADKLIFNLSANDRKIGEIMPSEIIMEVKKFVAAKGPEGAVFIKKLLEENESVNSKLMEATKRVIDDNVGNFIGSLVYKKVYESIKNSIFQYIEDEENIDKAINLINESIDRICEKDFGYYIGKIENLEEIKAGAIESLCRALRDSALQNATEQIYSTIKENLMIKLQDKNLYDTAVAVKPDIFEFIAESVKVELMKYYFRDGKRILEGYIEGVFNKATGYRINNFLLRLEGEPMERLKSFMLSKQQLILDKASDLIVKKLKVNEIVERKIIEYDVVELENMILNIAEKELKYITYMGGFLGLILGFLPEIINKLF